MQILGESRHRAGLKPSLVVARVCMEAESKMCNFIKPALRFVKH